jgi:TonB family protein
VRLPESLKPDSFREVAAGCLNRDPARRWTIADIQQWLDRGVVPAPKQAKRRYFFPTALAAGVVVAGVIARPYITGSSASSASPAAPVTAQPQTPAEPQPLPSVPATAPDSAPAPPPRKSAKTPERKQQPVASTDKSALAELAPVDPAQPQDPPPPVAATDILPPDVVQPVMPAVPVKSRSTIHGKVPIVVRIEADAAGSVTGAQIESGGSSKYFADLALKAARQWKFASGPGARAWTVRFEFTRNAERPVSAQVTPAQ